MSYKILYGNLEVLCGTAEEVVAVIRLIDKSATSAHSPRAVDGASLPDCGRVRPAVPSLEAIAHVKMRGLL